MRIPLRKFIDDFPRRLCGAPSNASVLSGGSIGGCSMKHIDCGPRRGVSARSESAIIRAPRRVAAVVACALCAAALVNPCDAKSRNIQKNQVVTIAVDAAADRVPINPLIYGMVLAQPHDVSVLNVPLNVWSGNTTTDYNWSLDA